MLHFFKEIFASQNRFHGNQTLGRGIELNHGTVRGAQKVETSLISCCSNVSSDAFAICHICRVAWCERGNKRRAGHASSLTATPGLVRFTRRGFSPKPRQKKSPYWNCFRQGVCTNTSKRIRLFVSWFPREYVLLCGVGPLIIELQKPRLPMDNLGRFGWDRADSHRKLCKGQMFHCWGQCPREIENIDSGS